LGQRSRKRSAGRGAAGDAREPLSPSVARPSPAAASPGDAAADAAPPRDSRATPVATPSSGPRVAAPAEPPRRRRRSSEERAAEARAQLVPLAEDERPGAVTVAAVVSLLLGILVVVGYATGARVGGEGSLPGALFLCAIFLVAAWGMWRVRYWAVLGFEALLAFQLVIAALSLMVASNWWAALLCVALIVFGGWLFWKLIRAMARIQMPERRPAS
jgi:hypothetical protein